jgi:hypothetical protein
MALPGPTSGSTAEATETGDDHRRVLAVVTFLESN